MLITPRLAYIILWGLQIGPSDTALLVIINFRGADRAAPPHPMATGRRARALAPGRERQPGLLDLAVVDCRLQEDAVRRVVVGARGPLHLGHPTNSNLAWTD